MAKLLKQMMILFATLVIFAMAVQSAPPQCGPNEEFVTCGSACPLTCGKEQPVFCTAQCIMGCRCVANHWKNNAGACVTKEDC